MSLVTQRMARQFFWVLAFLFCTRMLAMYYIPLNDSTEARYGEIARIMLETNNWITPMHQYNVPFWAKPPLSIWLSALSMKVLGVSPFAARLPGLLVSLGILGLIWGVAKRRAGQGGAMIATLVLAGTLYFYLNSGTVMTDPSLLFSTTLIMVAFWQTVMERQRGWRYDFFIGMGIGLLAKGPVALILAGIPIGLWVLIERRWLVVWRELPWFGGLLLTALIALPWYYLAELKTPGFLYYFIVGEHFGRFLQPGWRGDKYGFAHVAPYGMIWIYAVLGTIPWCIPGSIWLCQYRNRLSRLENDDKSWMRYLLLSALMPLVFFTFARNIIYPYVFPSLPAFALLFAELAKRVSISERQLQRLFPIATTAGFIFSLATVMFVWKPELVAKSQDRVVAIYKAQSPTPQSHLIYWAARTDYSAQFYSEGRATSTLYSEELCRLLVNNTKNYVVLDSEESHPISESLMAQLKKISEVRVLSKQYRIYVADHINC